MIDANLLGFGLLIAAAAAVVLGYLRQRRAARIRHTPVLVSEAMRLRGITPADAAAAGLEHEVYAAVGRCTACSVETQCRARLGEFPPAGPPAVCPNKAFFDEVAAHKAASQHSTA